MYLLMYCIQPELLAGSLRSNIDLLAQSNDAALNNALRAAGLSALQEEMEDGKITLDTEISAGGSNLSVGQRQIIALGEYIPRDFIAEIYPSRSSCNCPGKQALDFGRGCASTSNPFVSTYRIVIQPRLP